MQKIHKIKNIIVGFIFSEFDVSLAAELRRNILASSLTMSLNGCLLFSRMKV